MADDLQNYELQLQQVEAALLTDPENSELLKLKDDLVEVIELTQDLIKTQQNGQKNKSYVASIKPSSSTLNQSNDLNEIETALLAAEHDTKQRVWKIGDKCQAKWTDDGKYYDGIIENICDNGEVSVIFEAYQNRITTNITELKECADCNDVFPSAKRQRPNNKEYLKKKREKKQQRLKTKDEEREQDKNKWLNFTTKNAKKSGKKVKSIFATTDNVNGRVGVGTCGISGNPMTKFSYGEKYRKGM